jgi:hypothetical protein
MVKQSLKFMMAAALLVVSGSFARADTYSVVSDWHTGSTQFNDLVTYTGDGTFNWNGTTFSNIVFSFTETSPTNTVLWSAAPTDGELLNSNTELIIGSSGTDCGVYCVEITLNGAVTTGSPLALQGTGVYSQPNTTFDSATVTDTSHPLPEPSAIALFGTVSGILGFVIFRRRKLVR